MGWFILKGKDKGKISKKEKYNQEKMETSYKKQKEASDKVNRPTNSLYSAKIYNVSRAHYALAPTQSNV